MKCIRFDVCKCEIDHITAYLDESSMKCIRFDVCKVALLQVVSPH